MEGRTVLQWDKEDCADAGLVKFDLLSLGMLTALRVAFDELQADDIRADGPAKRRCASPLTNYKPTTFERMDRRIRTCAGGHRARCVDAGISLWGCILCQKKTRVSTTCSAPPTPWVCFRSSRARR